MIKQVSLLFHIMYITIAIASDGSCVDSMQEKIRYDLQNYMNCKNCYLDSINFLLPSCIEIDSIEKANKDSINVTKSYPSWYFYYLVRYSTKNIKYLLNQANGDDWIIGWYYKDFGCYLQFIDGRTFTVIIKLPKERNLNIKEDLSFPVMNKTIGNIIKFSNMFLNDKCTVTITEKTERFIKGYISNPSFSFSELKKDYFWTNGEYVVFDIVKLNQPVRVLKGFNGYYNYHQIIDGISKDDSRSFTRFRKSANIDMEKEMFKVFPWMTDSIQAFKAHPQTELYGRTPDYYNKNEEEDRKELLEFRRILVKDSCE